MEVVEVHGGEETGMVLWGKGSQWMGEETRRWDLERSDIVGLAMAEAGRASRCGAPHHGWCLDFVNRDKSSA